MKKILFVQVLLFVFVVSSYCQSGAVGIGVFLTKHNTSVYAENLLSRQGFSLMSKAQLKSAGHDPETTIIGMKGSNSGNSSAAVIKFHPSTQIKEMTFICNPNEGAYVDRDLVSNGFKMMKERTFKEGRFNIQECTYQRNDYIEKYVDTVVAQYGEDKSVQLTFTSKAME